MKFNAEGEYNGRTNCARNLAVSKAACAAHRHCGWQPDALEMKDYTIPSGATVKVYARPWGRETTYVQDATATGNTVVFTPQDGFFREGWNSVQLEINGSKIFHPIWFYSRQRYEKFAPTERFFKTLNPAPKYS
jgi:hypothetical protein